MSTPSPQPLDYDLVSPHAPKQMRDAAVPPVAADDEAPARPRPAAIENDNDARILEEIESSLRAMIAAEHVPPKEDESSETGTEEETPQRDVAETAAKAADDLPEQPVSPTIDTLEAPTLIEERLSQERRYYEAIRVQEVLAQVSAQLGQRSAPEAPTARPEPPMEEYRKPPAFLTRSMEPMKLEEPDHGPWPKARPQKPRSSATTLFVRFGFAAGGAAAMMLLALPDLRTRFIDTVATPVAALTSNAAAVFGEGRPAPIRVEIARSDAFVPIAVRTEPVVLAKEPDRFDAPMPKLAAAGLAPTLPDLRSPAVVENPPPPQEAVMAPQRAPEVAARPLSAEEIELLRKMANDFIAAGDFAGARGVLEHAAEAGDATAALQLATTYDPAALARFKVKGLAPDNAKAAFWYERARDLGSLEAPGRLKAMALSN